jgi:hypothetical protein
MRRTIGSLFTALFFVASVHSPSFAATPRVSIPKPKAGAVNTVTCNLKASGSYYTDPLFVPAGIKTQLTTAKCGGGKLPTQTVNGILYQFESWVETYRVGGYGPGSYEVKKTFAYYLRSNP